MPCDSRQLLQGHTQRQLPRVNAQNRRTARTENLQLAQIPLHPRLVPRSTHLRSRQGRQDDTRGAGRGM